MKATDSGAKPFIEQKDVILCRSGIQIYHKSELVNAGFITADNKPAVDKEWYREYRPANVIVKAQDLFKSLPVTKEHPDVWVDSMNWKELAGGTLDKEVSVVALDGESDGEIGLKSNITFYTDSLHSYYLNNREVSVGYTCKKHFVQNPDEVGYDIILDEITEVNHLAITRAGRGGSSVAVIDSILGGLKPMRTGIFAWLAGKKQKVNDSAPSSFGKEVLEAVKNSKGTTEEELASEMKGVLDSCAVMKDCEAKNALIDAVKDCFDNKEKALAEEVGLTAILDSMFVKANEESLKGFMTDSEPAKVEEKKEDEPKAEDSEPEKEDEPKAEDSEPEKDETKEDDGCKAKDSAPEVASKDDIIQAVKDSIKPMVMEAVKEVLGIKDDSKPEVTGGVVDSVINKVEAIERDYASFLD